jgi:hypothetical protein
MGERTGTGGFRRGILETTLKRITLKRIFKKWDAKTWTGFIWLRMGTGSVVL